jgi:hypothetical protein
MPDTLTISKTPQLDNSQDYNFLRTEGLKYIEELGSKLWTDYNEHDPGITILEALCYTITELGYRAGMPMQNLLADADGKIPSTQTFFTADNILTQAPLTIDDYRKLLIDIVGVHNAWLFVNDFYVDGKNKTPASEVPIYADCKNDTLTYNETSQQIYLSGLYKVLIDLDNDLQFGDLNNGEVVVLTPAVNAVAPARSFKSGDASLTISFPKWNDDNVNVDALVCNPSTIDVTALPVISNSVNGTWKLDITFSCDVNAVINIIGEITVDLEPASGKLTLADVQSFFTTVFSKQVIYLYILKIQKAKQTIQTAIRVLNENRNLCEDFVSVVTVNDEEIAICCDIDVKPSADIDEVQAKVFYAIEEYFNPTVKFYTLDELISKGNTTDEIFEGPKLTHGFIDTDELEAAQLRTNIYTSDIINLLMDIDGVTAVRNFRMTKYNTDGTPNATLKGKSWCMPVSPWHKPFFSETKSKIIFYKKQITYLPSLNEVRDTLKWLRASGMRNKLNGHALDIPLPDGTFTQLDTYTSIEYLFPLTYGIGKAGLPANVTDERRAQAKQLKAYLMFYDQLLADFFSQLKNAGSLFSVSDSVQTYYAQFLDTIKDIDAVYAVSGSTNLLQQLLQHQDAVVSPANAWQKLYESNETFVDRRNRFLDHLMSRFAESFNDYVLLMYSLNFQTQQVSKITPEELIKDKINFLKDYPQLSYERAKAFNYYPQKNDFTVDTTRLWDTDNVSGLEKKLCRLGGFDDPSATIKSFFRRFLYCINNATIVTTGDTPPKFSFIFTNANGDTITSSVYDGTTAEHDMYKTLMQVVDSFLAETNIGIKQTAGNWQVLVADNDGNILATGNDFTAEADANTSLQLFINEFNAACDDNDGLHLIEHILLRPRVPADSMHPFLLAPVCLDKDCDFCGEQDPYSFRITIVLPYWPAHIRSIAFREYFEDIVRREAPAHTVVKVCWLSNTSMYDFEVAYKNWLTALADYSFNSSTAISKTNFQNANDALVQLLFNLHSEYPLATLHDCAENGDTNSVVLGKTILGSFKN